MAQDRLSTPSSAAGLVRFYDVTSSNVQITPELVVGACAAFILVELVAHLLI